MPAIVTITPTLPSSKSVNPSSPASIIIPWTTRFVDVPISVHIPPNMAAYDSGMSSFFAEMPTLRHHTLTCGINITTMGVLFRNADINATVGSTLMYARRVDITSPRGNNCFISGIRQPLDRIPSLTRKSNATVITPLFEKPARASVVVITPVASSRITAEKSINPGRRYSFISRYTITAIVTITIRQSPILCRVLPTTLEKIVQKSPLPLP